MNFTILSHTSTFYGAPQSILMLSNELRRLGHQVNYVLPDSEGLFYEKLIEENYPVSILPNTSWTVAERKSGYSKWFYFKHKIKKRVELINKFIKSFRSYKTLIRKQNTDYIIVNTSVAPFGLVLGRCLRIKTIVFVREVLGSKEMNLKLIVPKTLVKLSLKKSSILIGPSHYIGGYFRSEFGVENFKKISNPIKTRSVFRIKHLHFKNSTWTFGLVGSLSVNKGQAEFIKEAVKFDQTITHIFGEGNDGVLGYIREQQILYPDKIKLHGYVNGLQTIYSKFEYYINLGKNESFGRTTIEAMCSGCIVFGRRSGATSELINHGINGFLFDDISEVFELLKEYHTEGRQNELKIIQKNAFEFSKDFSVENIAKIFLEAI